MKKRVRIDSPFLVELRNIRKKQAEQTKGMLLRNWYGILKSS
jgi:hypothetical protein